VKAVQLEIDGAPPPEPVLREGFCACGCGEAVNGRKFVSGAHRQRAYRARVKAEMERVGLPASPSLRAAGMSRPTPPRNGDAENAGKQPQRGRSGMQVSFPKAVAILEDFFDDSGYAYTHRLAVKLLAAALSDRQREQLRERKRACQAPTLTVAEQRDAYRQQEEGAA
jgi:hypothetical protein